MSFPLPAAAPAVPGFFIDHFQIPPFLLPIYQAAGIEYDVPWQILAAINEIETDYGRNLSISSAGAMGWMQFLPSTWKQYGVDANGDGLADPYNPVDAIFAAARYLHAAGASRNLRRAIYAYNHAGWYVESAMLRAQLLAGLPGQLLGALTGLVEGHFPVAAPATYAHQPPSGALASVSILAPRGAPVIAVNDGKIVKLGASRRLGRFIELQDVTGNTYTYAHLGRVAALYPVPKSVTITPSPAHAPAALIGRAHTPGAPPLSVGPSPKAQPAAPSVKERLFAHPSRPASYSAGGAVQLAAAAGQDPNLRHYFSAVLHLGRDQYTLKPLRVGTIVVGGTIIGRVGAPTPAAASRLAFMIQPAGTNAPHIDPRPILEGWKLLDAAVYRSAGINPFVGPGVKDPTIGQVLLMSKGQLSNRILADRRVHVSACERRDIQAGLIDRRVLAMIEFLSISHLHPTISGFACGYSSPGTWGTSVDITAINGIAIRGHQGPGSITDLAIRHLLTLQGALTPDKIVSLMSYPGQHNTLALPDHVNRIQVTYTPLFGKNRTLSREVGAILSPGQWSRLISRISHLPEPSVFTAPTKFAITPAQVRARAPRGTSLRGGAKRRHAGSRANSASGPGLTAQPMLGVPASHVEVIGASPGEAAGEAWARGTVGAVPATVGNQTVAGADVLLRYTTASGAWQVVPVADAQGQGISFTSVAAEVTPGGGVVLLGTPDGTSETLVTRDPGGAFSEAAAATSVLLSGESLYPSSHAPTMASIDEGGNVGALVAPGSESSVSPGVLHYVNGGWTREPICAQYVAATCTAPSAALTVVAVSASAPGNAWLLASAGSGATPLLFERALGSGSTPVWVEHQPTSWLLGSGSPPIAGETAAPPGSGPVLTASGQGVWVDMNVSAAGQNGSATVFVSPGAPGETAGTWCYPTSLCPSGTASLGATLPANYGSFAWGGSGPTDPGTRIISGLPTAALLRLSQGAITFAYETTGGDAPTVLGGGGTFGPGGETLTTRLAAGGAAFASPTEGWLGSALRPPQETPKVVHLTTNPSAAALTSWPVPFRRPLLALAGAPGTTPGAGGGQALAVGVGGEIARYTPGTGWVPEFLYNAAGARQTPTLRGVAWPEPGRAYAVGDNGAMWLWRGDTGLWQPDPAKPLNFHSNLAAVAFSPSNPNVGYAVGKQGALLAYGKTWSQEALPAAVAQAHFTSVTFAGGEAIAAYRMLDPAVPGQEQGGVLVNDGTGWQIDASAQALLASLPSGQTVITKVAGLPDGGAVAAGPGVVLERDALAAPWRFSSTPLADSAGGNIAALAAIRDGASVRALVSIDDDSQSDPSGFNNLLWQNIDNPPGVTPGQPPLLIGPDPLPSHGFLVRETSTGWVDVELSDHPNLLTGGTTNIDLPGWPDAVLGLLVDPTGGQGWAVGGQTGGDELQLNGASGAANAVQTAGVMRFGPGPAPPVSASAPIATPPGQATIAFGGGSGCAAACADNTNQALGPDSWLANAIGRANQISGLHAFVYTGQRVGAPTASFDAAAFDRELADYAGVLSGGGSLPVYAAATSQDVSPAAGGSAGFASILGAHAPAGVVPPGTPAPPAGTVAYAFDSPGNGGTVRVIVTDYAAGTLSAGGGAQLAWLAAQLDSAKQAGIPAIVVGGGDITDAGVPNAAADAGAVANVLLAHGASAYVFYDAVQQNVSESLGTGANTMPVFGTGTLGYVRPPSNAAAAQAFLGASGFLLLSVNAGQRSASTGRAPVTATLVPSAGQVALDATDGTLLARSQVALFQGLMRRPLGGEEWLGGSPGSEAIAPDPYTLLPENCLGGACARFIRPTYAFSSSNPQIGDFVMHDPNSTNPRQVLQDRRGKPIPDPTSGLFCAYNAGTTTVTISSGGLSYSEPVTVRSGSVQEPCGTVPFTPPPGGGGHPQPPPPPPPPPNPNPNPNPTPVPVTVPPSPAPVAQVAQPATHPGPVPPSTPTPPSTASVVPILPLNPLAARPPTPTGFGSVPVTSPLPVRVVEEERKEEEAVESVRNFALYRADDPGAVVPGVAILLLVLAAGVSGAEIRRRHRPRGGAAFARTEVRRERRW